VTLRGRLTSAFLVVVLGPVLLGAIFVALTVGAVSRERTAERLDHAAITVGAAMGAVCRQLQAAADAVAVVPATERSAVARQLIARGLSTEIRMTGTDQSSQTPQGRSRAEILERGGHPAGWQNCAKPGGGAVTAIAAFAEAADVTVMAAQRVDDALLARIGEAGGVTVTLADTASRASAGATGETRAGATGETRADTAGDAGKAAGKESGTGRGHDASRTLAAEPGRPLTLTLTVPASDPTVRYGILLLIVLVTALVAVLVARWLARSTTRPLGDLAWAADRVANGDLDTRVPIPRPDELGRLAGTFNRMTRELQSYVQALTASRDQLRRHLAILGDTLSSTHDLDRILPVILRTAMTATGARAGLILLAEPDGRLAVRCGTGLTGDWDVPAAELAQRRLVPGRGVLGTVAASGAPLRGTSGAAPDEPACESYLAVPICAPPNPEADGEPEPGTLGVLALYDRLGSPAFEDTDLRTLRTFAGQAGVAVHNVRVHEEAQRLSLTDPLTGLWNYRYLREVLRREVERANRFGRMLTVLVLDLDHFKEVNDTYGHAAGDLVLGEFARRIRLGLREVDVAFRQGGEEFVVLLPETDAYGGVIVAERLGAAVRDRPVPIDTRRSDLDDRVSITVSIGIAVFPEHGNTAQAVLDAADEALYAAKNSGRDTYRLAFDPAAATSGGPQPPRQVRGR
jgi:two-component system cell cycle response regulator